MNKVILIGRLTKDPDINTYANGTTVAKYTLAVDRRYSSKNDNEPTADFIGCTVFGKGAEFAQKYLFKGTKIAIEGRIQTGSYTNKDGQKIYTTDIIVDSQEFAESKSASQGSGSSNKSKSSSYTTINLNNPAENFINIPDTDDEELPFN